MYVSANLVLATRISVALLPGVDIARHRTRCTGTCVMCHRPVLMACLAASQPHRRNVLIRARTDDHVHRLTVTSTVERSSPESCRSMPAIASLDASTSTIDRAVIQPAFAGVPGAY